MFGILLYSEGAFAQKKNKTKILQNAPAAVATSKTNLLRLRSKPNQRGQITKNAKSKDGNV